MAQSINEVILIKTQSNHQIVIETKVQLLSLSSNFEKDLILIHT